MSVSNGLKSGKKTILPYIIIYYIYNRIAMVVNSMVIGNGQIVNTIYTKLSSVLCNFGMFCIFLFKNLVNSVKCSTFAVENIKNSMKPIKLYKVEVGVLLGNTDPEYEENKTFTFGPHDPKHAYLDENTAFFTNKKNALRWLRNYVKKGVLNTYGVLSELIYDQNDPSLCYDDEDTRRIVHDIRNYGIFEDWVGVFESDLYNPKFVTYTLHKVDYNKYAKIF